MDDSLRDAFSVKVGDEVDEVEVLKEEGAIDTGALSLVRVRPWDAVAGGVEGFLAGGVAVVLVGSELSGKALTIGLAVG